MGAAQNISTDLLTTSPVLGGEYPALSLVCYLSSHWEL